MAYPYSGPNSNAERACEQMDNLIASAMAQVIAWRADINSGAPVDSMQAQTVYQALLSLRVYSQTFGGIGGLKEAVLRRFPGLPGTFAPGAEWTAANTAIKSFGDWFAAKWPERTTSGKPAFLQFNTTTGETERFTVNLGAAIRAELIGQLDGVINSFQVV